MAMRSSIGDFEDRSWWTHAQNADVSVKWPLSHLQLEPVEQVERGRRAGPVQDLAQLVQERHAAECLEAQPAQLPGTAAEHERVPTPPAPAMGAQMASHEYSTRTVVRKAMCLLDDGMLAAAQDGTLT